MKRLCLVVLGCLSFQLLSGCARRSFYKPLEMGVGYSDGELEDKIYFSRFIGNNHTTPNVALMFAKFRAIEVCRDKGLKFPIFVDLKDDSVTASIRKFYSFNGDGAAWDEKQVTPVVSIAFACSNEQFSPLMKIRSVDDEKMEPYVKDLFGAVQVMKIDKDSPNVGNVFDGDIIIKINGIRITDSSRYAQVLMEIKKDSTPEVVLIRDGNQKKVSLRGVDKTEETVQGIKTLITDACKNYFEVRYYSPLCNKQ